MSSDDASARPAASGEVRGPRSVSLASATDLDGFRGACRALWAAQVPPEQVEWHSADVVRVERVSIDWYGPVSRG